MSYAFHDFGVCCGTVARADFRDLVTSASAAGFRGVSLWPTTWERALESGLSTTDMRSILADHDVVVTELDPLSTWLPAGDSPFGSALLAYDEDLFFRIADALGGRSLNAIHATNTVYEDARMVDALSGLAERAAAHGLVVSLEFLPWSPIPDLETALRIVDAVDRADVGVNVDTWHHFRSGGTLAQLAALDPRRVTAVQLNDVAAEAWDDVLAETMRGRLLPGEGVSDTAAVLGTLDDIGVRVPLNVEVFSDDLNALSTGDVCARLADSVRKLLG